MEKKFIVLFAYCKCETFRPFLHTSMPSRNPKEIALWEIKLRGSTSRLKRNGERGSPWRSPLWSLKDDEGDPLMRIDVNAVMTHELIHPHH